MPAVHVLAAASLVDLFGEIHPAGLDVRCTFGASSQVRSQVEHGAPADVFVGASTDDARQLEREKLLDGERVLYRNNLVVVTPSDAEAEIWSDASPLRDLKRVAVGDPATVPAGRYGQQALRKLALWEPLRDRLVVGADVRVVLGWVERGEVDAGIVYETDARAATGSVDIAYRFPSDSHDPILYVGGVVTGTPHREAADAFLAALASPQGQAAARVAGFEPVMSTPSPAASTVAPPPVSTVAPSSASALSTPSIAASSVSTASTRSAAASPVVHGAK